MKSALVTGIRGQDGRHLTELLLARGYQVYGVINGQKDDAADFGSTYPEVRRLRADLADSSSLVQLLQEVQPDEIYNLGAISFVALSFTQPELTSNITGLGALRLFEAIRLLEMQKNTRIFQASSSEMFGKVQQIPQNELTPFYPRSPYAVSKVFAHQIAVNYREAYDFHLSCGIMFNHEGPYRGYEFVTRKITQGVARIKLGLQSELRLGNLDAKRDWGFAGDFVEAMWAMLQQPMPDDYVISTGQTHSVREFVDAAFEAAGLENGLEKYVKIDERFKRPSEVDLLIGDSTKAQSILNWKPTVNFHGLVQMMVENDLRIESKLNGK
jgi:GDPmannose 4,6-dehydratase